MVRGHPLDLGGPHSNPSPLPPALKVKAHGPGLEKTGVPVNKPAEFTVDARSGGKAPLKVQMQVSQGGLIWEGVRGLGCVSWGGSGALWGWQGV